MSRYDYMKSREIAAKSYPFYALLMATMREADSDNIQKLRSVFPEVWDELYERYNSPEGKLGGE
jgi:hypothetical protein